MAKNNNLTDFLTDIANAIREKEGSSELINPQDFSNRILALQNGGGSGDGSNSSVGKNDVNFYDYDGTIIYSYSNTDFLSMSDMPPLPSQNGLTCQGWNYSLTNAQTYVSKYGKINIGAMYITDDGKTRLYIRIAELGRMTVPLCFTQTVSYGVTIDWGDGSATQTVNGTGVVEKYHTYDNIGDYCITLSVTGGCTLGLGNNKSGYCVMGSTSGHSNKVYTNMLKRVEIGQGVTSIGTYAFYNCCSLASIAIPQGVTSISNNTFYYCYSLASIAIPQGVTSIGTYAFNSCYSLASIAIPQGVTSIGTYAFYNCQCMSFYDFRALSSVPSLQNKNAFTSNPSDFKIVVPDSLYDSWKTATNWSTYASNIIKASEFTL